MVEVSSSGEAIVSRIDLRTKTLANEHVSHVHGYHQLILPTCGSTELSLEGREQRVTAERGCLIPGNCHHDYLGDGNNRTFVLDVPVVFGLPDVDVARLFERPRFFAVPPDLQRLADSLMRQLDQFPTLGNDIAALLLRALYLHLEASSETCAPTRSTGVSGRLDLRLLDDWIDRHLASDIRVDDLASLCALSPGHFHASFRQATGMTPQAYVRRRRLSHAQALIRHSELPLGQIGALVGFRDQGSFSRAYRRVHGVAPSQERTGF